MKPFIRLINCDRRIGESARYLVWRYEHLRYKDAIHVASAMSQTIDILYSYDNDDLVRLNGKIGTPPLRICNPGVGDGFGPPAQPELQIKPNLLPGDAIKAIGPPKPPLK
jgi:hypothetical protein